MKLEFSFKDVPQDILHEHRNIDLSKNTVIYGNNGRGKTRILTTIDTIHKIAKKDFEIKLLNLIDDMNLDTLQIDGIDYTELVHERNDENDRILSEEAKETILRFIQRKTFFRRKAHNKVIFIYYVWSI